MSKKLPLFEEFTNDDKIVLDKLGVPDTHQFFVYTYEAANNVYGALIIAYKSMEELVGELDSLPNLKKYGGSLIGVSFYEGFGLDPDADEMVDTLRMAFEDEYLSNIFDETILSNQELVNHFKKHIQAAKEGKPIMDWDHRLDHQEFYF
jgi:hypothetical protein